MTPPEHLKRGLDTLLTAWQIATADDLDPATTGHWRATTKLIATDALAALEGGMTPYEVKVLIIAPAFLGADEIPAEVVEHDDEVSA